MNTLVDQVKSVIYDDGHVRITMESDLEIRFPVAGNPRLSNGTPPQLNNIEVSSLGLHWPDLDEDLSFRGVVGGGLRTRQNVSNGKEWRLVIEPH